MGRWRLNDDLRPRRAAAATRAAAERAAVFGHLQSGPDRVLRGFRADFPHPVPGAVGACDHRRSHETGAAAAPRGGGGHPSARPAAGLSALGSASRPQNTCAWQANALIRRSAMLSTAVNPTDGLRFDGSAASAAEGDVHPQILRRTAAERSWQWRTDFRRSAKPTRSMMSF